MDIWHACKYVALSAHTHIWMWIVLDGAATSGATATPQGTTTAADGVGGIFYTVFPARAPHSSNSESTVGHAWLRRRMRAFYCN